ncbi:CHAT domain-containing protein [Flagelloscypha sp. PMI_526]|nr:CHAT domain-containing protein [Flagelloscypha sp. PMI_526]
MAMNAMSELIQAIEEDEDYLGTFMPSEGDGTDALQRFLADDQVADIDTAIRQLEFLVKHLPEDHPNKLDYLNNLALSHVKRFDLFGNVSDIDKAIECDAIRVEFTPDGHPGKPSYLNFLGNSHQKRFERLGELSDIEKAIECHISAVQLCADGHPDQLVSLGNLGDSYAARFEHCGETQDINKAIEYQCKAVKLTPDGHPIRPSLFNNLGLSYRIRFERLSKVVDLDKSIQFHLRAVELTPDGHPDKPAFLNNLGNSHQTRSQRHGDLADMDKSIEYHLNAIQLTPDGHLNRSTYLNNLAISHQMRFDHLGDVADVDNSLKEMLKAVKLTADGHPDKPACLNNLGISHARRFERSGEIADIDEAIKCQLNAIQLTGDSHPNRAMYLGGLGHAHTKRFERFRDLGDIEKAIKYNNKAVDLTPDDHPDKPICLKNLGISLQTRFERLGEIADIDTAIKCLVNAIQLTPDDHPEQSDHLNMLGLFYHTRFEHFGKMADIDDAIKAFEQSATSTASPAIFRFRGARAWIFLLRRKHGISLFKSGYLLPQHTLINLIPELVWLGAPVHQRLQAIQDVVGSSIHEAVSMAIRAQKLELAVEWMEQGRSIVWGQLRRLRSPLIDLEDAHPFLAQQFQTVQRRIETSFLHFDADQAANTPLNSLEQQAQAHRRNIQKREELLTEIRGKQGFESFLLPEKFSVLSKACSSRLAVLLTVSGDNCDALAILPSGPIIHLPLTNVSQDDISDMHTQWQTSRTTHLNNRGEIPAPLDVGPMTSLLSDLWENIVHPVVKEIEAELWDSAVERIGRIIWCPSGPLSFLPLHAAGIYSSNSEDRISIADFAVSSYAPSLMALASNSIRLGRPSILLVTQPNTPNQKALPGTIREAERVIEKAASNGMKPYVHHLSQSQATVPAVVEQLPNHGWVHLACHGIQMVPDPTESSFALHGGNLTLASLMQKSMGNAQFAFLSACQTATGNQSLPDEAMHLTSAMLAAGFPSVVGTIWSIEDMVAPEVAETFYGILFEEGGKSNWEVKPEPAYALHFALQKLREETTGAYDLMNLKFLAESLGEHFCVFYAIPLVRRCVNDLQSNNVLIFVSKPGVNIKRLLQYCESRKTWSNGKVNGG